MFLKKNGGSRLEKNTEADSPQLPNNPFLPYPAALLRISSVQSPLFKFFKLGKLGLTSYKNQKKTVSRFHEKGSL